MLGLEGKRLGLQWPRERACQACALWTLKDLMQGVGMAAEASLVARQGDSRDNPRKLCCRIAAACFFGLTFGKILDQD